MIGYTLRFPAPHTHRIEVELTVSAPEGRALEVAMPAWSPGSYLVRDYARHVEDLRAESGGRAARVRKLDKHSWRIESDSPGPVRVRYQVYAHELTVRTSHHDDRHAFVHGPSVLVRVLGREDEACEVRVEAPAGWTTVTALHETAPGVFRASGYDELADSPIEVGQLEVLRFDACGRPHTIAVIDPGALAWDREALVADTRAVVEEVVRFWGGEPPYQRYAFIVMLQPGAHGGLEHKASSAILTSPFSLPRPGKGWDRKKYEDLLELLCHEFFHTWNVKRIRPEALGPFDYARENYTRALWAMEGITSYYDRLLVRRAGRMSIAGWCERTAEDLGKLRRTPGRNLQSLEESSFDAWIKLYKPDEHSVNSTVSYYLKGSLVMLALDLEIRLRTEGRRTLDDGMRALWEAAKDGGPGFEDASFRRRLGEAVGLELGEFFARFVEGREDPPLEELVLRGGLALAPESTDEEEPKGWLGWIVEGGGGALRVRSVLDGGPASKAGVYPGVVVVALDGYRVTGEGAFGERLGRALVGETVRLTLFRRERLSEVQVVLEAAPPNKWTLEAAEGAGAEAVALREAWLGKDTKPPGDTA